MLGEPVRTLCIYPRRLAFLRSRRSCSKIRGRERRCPSMDWVKRFGRAFGQMVFLFIIASAFGAVSIFDVDENFSSYSRDIFYQVFAPLYPGSSDRAATVVLLNDVSFRSFDSFPVRYGTHAMIHRAVIIYFRNYQDAVGDGGAQASELSALPKHRSSLCPSRPVRLVAVIYSGSKDILV